MLAELQIEITELQDNHKKLHDRYVHIATGEVFRHHPLKDEVLELIMEGLHHLELSIKARRELIAGMN